MSRTLIPPGPIVLLLAPFALGITVGWYADLPGVIPLYTLPILIACMLLLHNWQQDQLFSIALLLTAFTCGIGRVQIATESDPNSVMKLPNQMLLTAEGHLASVEQNTKTTPSGNEIPWSKATLRVHRIKLRNFTRPASGTLQIYTFRKPAPYSAGDRVRVQGMLKKSGEQTNPGDMSWKWYRQKREIGGSLVIQTNEDWKTLKSRERCVAAQLTALRHWIYKQIESGDYPLQLVPAMVLGMRDTVDQRLESTFQRSGTIHFFAVSGLHVGFLLLGGFLLLRILRIPPGTSSITLLLLATLYLLITGFRLPTLRASVMICLLLLGIQLRKNVGSLQIIGIAGWILLLYHPLDLFSPGFHFSLLSVTGLVVLSRILGMSGSTTEPSPEKRLLREFLWVERLKARVWSLVSYGLSVMTATYVVLLVVGPLILYHFHLVSPGSLLANPVLFLTIPLLLTVGFAHILLAILSGLGIPLIPWLLSATGLTLHGLESLTIMITETVSGLPGSYLYLPAPNGFFLGLYYAVLLVIWWSYQRFPWPKTGFWLGTTSCFLLLIISGYTGPITAKSRASLTMLEVGHGSSFILSDRSNHHIVYDCGSTGYSDPGKWVTGPALWRRGTSTIDLLILSHSDLDHISGVRALAHRFSISTVWVSPFFSESPEGKRLIEELNALGSTIKYVSAGHTETYGSTTLTVHSPPKQFDDRVNQSSPSANATSLVVQAETGNRSVLFTGDLENVGKTWFRTHQSIDAVDVLQVPHHGGSGAAEQPLSSVLQTKFALISASDGTVSSHVVRKYQQEGAKILNTADHGAIQLRWSLNSSFLSTYKWSSDGWSNIAINR